MKHESDGPKKAASDAAPELPEHPRGKAWKWRHVMAAHMAARGCTWREIGAKIGVREDTASHYPTTCDGWAVLFGHFRGMYVAELEDRLFEPALNALYDVLTTSKNEFARLQAIGLIFAERSRTYIRIDRALKQPPRGIDADSAPTVIDNTIQAPDDDVSD